MVLRVSTITQFFYWHQNNQLHSIISSHIDDFFWAGTEWFIETVIEHTRKKYAISKDETETFKYLRLQILGGIIIHQKDYIEEIPSAQVDNPSQKDRVLSPKENQQLRRIAGQLNWVSAQTRPDMAYAASIVSGSMKDARVRDFITPNKFFKY